MTGVVKKLHSISLVERKPRISACLERIHLIDLCFGFVLDRIHASLLTVQWWTIPTLEINDDHINNYKIFHNHCVDTILHLKIVNLSKRLVHSWRNSCFFLKLSLLNPWKPGVKLEQRRRSSNCIWLINSLIAYNGVVYIWRYVADVAIFTRCSETNSTLR